MAYGPNKEDLTDFLFKKWSSADYTGLSRNLFLYVAHKEICHCIKIVNKVVTVTEVTSLKCDHEEADTRMYLHAKHASQFYDAVIIKSPDTDVAIIGLGTLKQLDAEVFFCTGVKNRSRIINLNSVANCVGSAVCDSIIAFHVFTGCDTTSSFYGKGKKKAYNILLDNEAFLLAFSRIGRNFSLPEDVEKVIEKFVCILYGQTQVFNVNEARYRIFCASSSQESLPPTQDELYLHLNRTNYQAAIHKHSLTPIMNAPSPAGNGWEIKDEQLNMIWMTKAPAPDKLLEVVHCSCKSTKCMSGRCSCLKAHVSCTDLCKCSDCSNNKNDAITHDDGAEMKVT